MLELRKNGTVDAPARDTTLDPSVDIRHIPYVDMKRPIKKLILDK